MKTVPNIIESVLGVSEEKIKPDARLKENLGADSMDMLDLAIQCEEAYGVELTDEEMSSCETVRDLHDLIEWKKKK